MPKKKPTNHNVNVNMQDTMVRALDELVVVTGSSTRAELVRILVRDEAQRRGVEVGSAAPKKAKAPRGRR
jgi:metal-responsive CopG/Arc/MetJ family transcriptional regulator